MIPRAEIAWLELELQAFSSDREYRDGLGQARFDGAVRAYERLGLLSAEEAARWRERFADKQRLVNPHRVTSRPEHAKPGAGIGQLRLSALGC